MAQCKRTNSNGKQCANRAVPGTEFCSEHRERLTFTRAAGPNPDSLPRVDKKDSKPSRDAAKKTESPAAASAGKPLAKPSPASGAPRGAGLRRDSRAIIVGPEAVIWLADLEKGAPSSNENLIRLLSGLSAVFDLSSSAQLHRFPQGHGYLVMANPPEPGNDNLSRLYDGIATTARFFGGEMYIGSKGIFVQYRDEAAAFGYDLETDGIHIDGQDIILCGQERTVEVARKDLEGGDIRDIVMQSVPIKQPSTETAGTLYILAASELLLTFSRYLRSHHLRYRLTRLVLPGLHNRVLFSIEPRFANSSIPLFIISHIQSFPRAVILKEAYRAGTRQVLVEIGCNLSWSWPETIGAFAENCLLAFTRHRDFPNICIEPCPSLIDGDSLIALESKSLGQCTVRSEMNPALQACRFEIRFQRDNGPPAPAAALLLRDCELLWLRLLLYKLPAGEFAGYKVYCASPYSMLLSDQSGVRDMPFGVSMKRVLDSGLFIPRYLKLIPDLPWDSLAGALHLDPSKLTFMTESFRIEIPADGPVPLSARLFSHINRDPVNLKLLPPTRYPALQWRMPDGLLLSEPMSGTAETTLRADALHRPPALTDEDLAAIDVTRIAAAILTKAGSLGSSADHLGAALYYALAGNHGESAEYFRKQANTMHTGKAS
jgi:hypothetical protein